MKRLVYTIILAGILLTGIQAQETNSGLSSLARIQVKTDELKLDFSLYKNKYLRLHSVLPLAAKVGELKVVTNDESENEVFIHISGENRSAHHGSKLTGGNPGQRLKFIAKTEVQTASGKQIVFEQLDTVYNLKVESFYIFYNNIPVIRRYTRITNMGNSVLPLEYVSSAMLHNFSEISGGKPQDNLRIHYAINSWQQEAQWKNATPSQLGWENNGDFNLNTVSFTNIGSWSSIKYLPMGMIENRQAGITWFWQTEHNGSWHTELANASNGSSYLYLGGPDAEHHQALKNLAPGETYATVPVALGCVSGGFNEAVAALTQYRRTALIRYKAVNEGCPIVFNDYMNCLFGNPLTETELPLISAASKAGCNYYVIDAGWYAEKNESWWDAVGLWNPSKTRFAPHGLMALMDSIRVKGMIPGLWLEPEVVGINSPLKSKPDNWFLLRQGKRVIDNSRYLLDFRNPEVRRHMHQVVARMVNEYGAGYIKMDYNNSAWGAETDGSSDGQGLLEHNRAVLSWYKEIAEMYPKLVVENCGSGGCRMDYAMLSVTQLQSSSDQTNYKKYPSIIVGAMAAVAPEQLAAWSYPRRNSDVHEAAFNMVSAMLCRIHQSGHLAELSPQSFKTVSDGLKIYKSKLAPVIPKSVPFFPLGMPSMNDSISAVSVGLKNASSKFISVWRLAGESKVYIPESESKSVQLIYPENQNIKVTRKGNGIQLEFPEKYMAAIVELKNE
jgi:alpha-galactosidase